MPDTDSQPQSFWARSTTSICLLVLLAGFSIYLAMDRIYQVDECQNVYVARILASGWSGHFYSSSELLHLLPLTWLAGRFQDSGSLYTASRLVMILVFWLNTLLTATACGIPWKDKKFIWVLLGAATLAPLWDYGFEIRHDNLVLLFLLLSWNLLRNPRGPAWFLPFALGALAAIMQFATFKAFIYWVPLGAIVMVVPPLPLRGKRLRVFLLMLLGFLAAGLLVALAFKWSGQLSTFMEGIRMALSFSSDGASRFGPWDTLARLIFQAPLLLGVGVAALVWNFSHFNSERQAPNVWGGVFPETLFLCVALLALLANPAPYPYNLVLLTPFAFILSVRWLVVACEGSTLSPTMTRLAIMVVLFTHMTPFVKSTLRHLDFSNDRQQLLMATAEALTDPARDCVYDASGLVASRKSAGYQWFLHSLIVNRIYEGRLPGLAQMLAQNPAPVVIPSYRFVWLRPEDVSFIQAHYLGLAGDFYVLGGALKGPNPTYECLRAGRYEVSVLAENHVGVRPAVQMDGQALNLPAVLSLPVGNHSFAFQADASLKITWLGPVLKQSPVLPPGDADRVFINWY